MTFKYKGGSKGASKVPNGVSRRIERVRIQVVLGNEGRSGPVWEFCGGSCSGAGKVLGDRIQ